MTAFGDRGFPALAAPASLLMAAGAMGLVSVLPQSLTAVGAAVLLAGPVALGVWAHGGAVWPAVLRTVGVSVAGAAVVLAVIVFGVLPVFEYGRGLSATGVWLLVRAPVLLLGLATVVLRPRDGGSDLRIAALWVAALAATVFGDRLAVGVALIAGADAVSGGLAFLAVPSVGLALWCGGMAARGSAAWHTAAWRAMRSRGREDLGT